MRKKILKERIADLLSGKEDRDVYLYDDAFHVISDGEIIQVTKHEAVKFLEHGVLHSLKECKRSYDHDKGCFVGEDEPEHEIPDGLPPTCRIMKETMFFPVSEMMRINVEQDCKRK